MSVLFIIGTPPYSFAVTLCIILLAVTVNFYFGPADVSNTRTDRNENRGNDFVVFNSYTGERKKAPERGKFPGEFRVRMEKGVIRGESKGMVTNT